MRAWRLHQLGGPSATSLDEVPVPTHGGAEPAAGDRVVLAVTPVDGFDAEVVLHEVALDLAAVEPQDRDGQRSLGAAIVEPAA